MFTSVIPLIGRGSGGQPAFVSMIIVDGMALGGGTSAKFSRPRRRIVDARVGDLECLVKAWAGAGS
jgi:hypothetical protein